MSEYRTNTVSLGENYRYQQFYDSEDKKYFVKLYRGNGGPVKICDRADTEEQALKIALDFLEGFTGEVFKL